MFNLLKTLLPEPKPERLHDLVERERETKRYADMKRRVFSQEEDMQLSQNLVHLQRDSGPIARSR